MIVYWIKDCYKENQLHLWMLNCLTKKHFKNLIIKTQTQQSEIELRQKIINQIIAKNARWSYMYANYILHSPFPAGEPAIATDAGWSYLYAKFVLCDPFPAGEPAIATEIYYSYEYACWILNKPFPLGEPTIIKDPYFKKLYEYHFKIKL